MAGETMGGDFRLQLGDARPVEAQCAAEPIHTPGSIQPHGMLLAVDPGPGLRIVAASANAAGLSARDGAIGGTILGRSVAEVLDDAFAAALAQRARIDGLKPPLAWETSLSLRSGRFDVASHAHAGLLIVELEPVQPADAESALLASRRMQHALATLGQSRGSLDKLAADVARSLRWLTGYERVLVYRFDDDWNGEAIAEDKVHDWPQSLRGMHFPASDIPSQARALYRVSPMRWVPARDAEPVRLLAVPGAPPIDLSHARLRSLSPVHLQYHRNLGVNGTMSLSIMDGPRLWGLMVFHHRAPHRTSAAQRAAAAAVTDAFAFRIGPIEWAGLEQARQAEQRRFAALITHMAQVDDLQVALTSGPVTILDLFDATGAAVILGEAAVTVGTTPPRADVLRLARWLAEAAPDGPVFSTAILPELAPAWEAHAREASGVMVAFLDQARHDMLIWFRPEEPELVSWGGNPHKTAEGALTPRLSFERWVEERRGHARRWQKHETEVAGMLHHAIAEVIMRNMRRIRELNDQLRQSQKMEAVGQLTGGLAHDFNNLLGGITGSIELAQTRLAQGRTGDIGRLLTAAQAAAGRAASLTHRLLAFSRRQTLSPAPVDVNRLVASMEELIRRTVGPSIRLDCVTSAGLWPVLCDSNQLENAILNLALNGRDAMPGGGRLTIEATNARLDDAYAAQHDISPGHFVALSVSDTGQGMDAEVARRAFEPFFTTKPLGKGTGLGLSMVYGFMRQSGGQARIYSEPGHGTTVRLYLPRSQTKPTDAPEPDIKAPVTKDFRSSLLVVDDEPVLRMLMVEVLQENGFVVSEAADGHEALKILRGPATIDLLLTDVGLPGGLNGRQLVDAARTLRPRLRVMFVTGYAENAALDGGVLDPSTQVLTKPFRMMALVEKIKGMVA